MLYFRIVNPNKEYNTIIVPIDFKTIIDGLKLGLEYIIKLNSIGFCPFLKSNLCIINDIKPIACKKFPYLKNNCLRNHNYYL